MSTDRPAGRASTIPLEARAHQGRGAGIVSRLLAAGVDLAVVVGVLAGVYAGSCVALFVLHPRTFSFPQPTPELVFVAYALVGTACLAAPWAVTGRSCGQQVMGLRVTTRSGELIGFPRALLRAAICIVFPISLLWALVDRRGAAVHDRLLGTTVRYDWATRSPGASSTVDSGADILPRP